MLPALLGGGYAVLAAVLFGGGLPLLQRLGDAVDPWLTACLLYAGAALPALLRCRSSREAPLRMTHLPRVLAMALCGAMLAPALLSWGVQRTSAVSASLLLAFEAVATIGLAGLLLGERLDRRTTLAAALITAGALLLLVDRSDAGSADALGLLAVLAATLAWGLDNTLSRPLADRNPAQVVLAKSLCGAAGSLLLAWGSGASWPALAVCAALLLLGIGSYGLSLHCYLLAQRSFGVARTASVFAIGPFIGALLAVGLGDRTIGAGLLAGAVCMLAGVLLHLAEQHDHPHQHPALSHEHAHRHDDGHHDHPHTPAVHGLHSHWHQHTALQHSHPHSPDLHHTHRDD